MSDQNEPVSKRLRNRNRLSVPKAQQPSTSRPTSNETQEPQPSDSLLRLSDGILQKIFVHLDIPTLCDVANVCKQFRKVAREAFSEKHKKFVLEDNSWNNSSFRRVLCKFGDLIESVNAMDVRFPRGEKIDTDAIAKYCSKNLENLSLGLATINCTAFMPIFSRLKTLELDMCEFVGDKAKLFKSCKNLENLFFVTNEPCGFVVQKYPKLTGLDFDCNYPAFFRFFELLSMNPQLKFIRAMEAAEDIYISNVVEYTKNVERFAIQPGRISSTPEEQTRKVFLQLAKLKKLKKLSLDIGYEDEAYGKSIAQLADAFVKQKINLDELTLDSVAIGTNEIKSIVNLKSLEALSLREVKHTVKEADLVSLTKNLPSIRWLQLYFGYDYKYSMKADVLVKMVKAAKKMTYLLLLGVKDLKINEKDFKTMLEAAQKRDVDKRLTIHIIGCKNTTGVNVPQNIQDASVKHLKINYESNDEF